MAEVELTIAGRSYAIACRDGGEDHLRTLARHVDKKAIEAQAAVGGMNEARQLLFAALLIADEMAEAAKSVPEVPTDGVTTTALAQLATRIEAVADALETRG
jgi:cell division protein ZapA